MAAATAPGAQEAAAAARAAAEKAAACAARAQAVAEDTAPEVSFLVTKKTCESELQLALSWATAASASLDTALAAAGLGRTAADPDVLFSKTNAPRATGPKAKPKPQRADKQLREDTAGALAAHMAQTGNNASGRSRDGKRDAGPAGSPPPAKRAPTRGRWAAAASSSGTELPLPTLPAASCATSPSLRGREHGEPAPL